jgi:hypothetical protein
MTIQVNVSFTLDIDADEWEGRARGVAEPVDTDNLVTRLLIAHQVQTHAESVVRDLFYDQGWIAEHHPAGHSDKADCRFCGAA